MNIGTILLVVIVLLLIGAVPVWPYSRRWGYVPGGVLAALLVVVLIMVLVGRI